MKNQFKGLLASFRYAFRGIGVLVKEERNFKIHLLATVIVITAGFYFDLNQTEWCLICLTIGIVLVAEGINTAIEKTLDFITEERNPKIGRIKDIAAGATLIAAIIALIIAVLIFGPKIALDL